MRARLATASVLLVLASAALAADAAPPPPVPGAAEGANAANDVKEPADGRRAALEKAQPLVARALEALRAGRGEEAADLLSQARSVVPGAPVVAYDQGIALAASGKTDEARDAYREALRQGTSSIADVAVRARHNLGLLQLLAARDVQALLETPGALEDAVRAEGAPGGEPLTPSMVTMLASQLRAKAIDDGLTNARGAIEVLRDTVRTTPQDRDAVRNLVLAQRARRFLEEQQKKQQEQQSEQDEKNDENADQQQQQDEKDGQGDDGKPDEEGDDEQQKPSAGDEKADDAEQKPGRDGASTDAEGDSQDSRAGEQRDIGREEAQRALEQLLDAARLKARQVENLRAARLRRGAVEKDW